MAKLVRVARGLCALVFCFQAVFASMDSSLPPEDLDTSGDDDNFSGSGERPLPEHSMIALHVPVQETVNTTLQSVVLNDLGENQPKAQGTESPTEDSAEMPASPASTLAFPKLYPVTDEPGVATEGGRNSLTEQGTTRAAVVTTRSQLIHHVSTVRVTPVEATSTVIAVEPEVNHGVHHVSTSDEEVPPRAVDFVPTSERSLATSSPTTISSTVYQDTSSLPGEGSFAVEYGSGNQEDFTFNLPEENAVIEAGAEVDKTLVDAGHNDAKSAVTPQGLMDRKEVLGGVIAGGLVGLLFAAFLVGFMLYRMKKKDEGSYSLDEPKQSNGGYQKPHKQEEFYA
uniref:Syndecan n=1 Tax=Salvator merianae TaxID=96440 RepID=A0A8D0BAQ8_SALMN